MVKRWRKIVGCEGSNRDSVRRAPLGAGMKRPRSYWPGRGNDGLAASAWSANLSYTPDTPPTGWQSSPGDTATIETREPELRATGYDSDLGDSISFQFQVARDSGFATVVGTSD